LPQARRSIIDLIPAPEFGQETFTPSLPEKFVAVLKDEGLQPLLFVSCGREFMKMDYWFAPDLSEQIEGSQRDLALSIGLNLLRQSAMIYYMNFQRHCSSSNSSNQLFEELYRREDFWRVQFFKYISRFTDPPEDFDFVCKVYTDYFPRQFLYSYSWSCMSKIDIHGGYNVYIRGDSVDPAKIIRFAESNTEQQGIQCRISEISGDFSAGFKQFGQQIVFSGFIPDHFFSHMNFWKQLYGDSFTTKIEKMQFQVSGSYPEDYLQQKRVHFIIRAISVFSLLFLTMVGFNAFLFGLKLPLSIRKKLLAVIGTIFLLPIASTAILSYHLYNGFDKIVERHILAEVEGRLNRLEAMESEKYISLQQKNLQLKKHFEQTSLPIAQILDKNYQKQCFPDLKRWNSSINFLEANGYYGTTNAQGQEKFQLPEGLLAKYLINQGLAKFTAKRARELEVKISLTLGLLENFLTPEIEEEIIPKEGAVHREITHTVDTYLGSFLFCRRDNGEYAFLNARFSNNEPNFYDYLINLNLSENSFFKQSSDISDIKSGTRLRKHTTFTSYRWPAEVAFDNDLIPYFTKALHQRTSGTKIIRNPEGITIASWRFRDSHQGIFVAIGKSRKLNEIEVTISLLFPFTAGYSIILLMILSGIFSKLFVGPIDDLESGISEINQNRYGAVLSRAKVSEFEKLNNAFNEMSVALKQNQMMSRYLSDHLVKSIEKEPLDSSFAIESTEVTVLSSDIRGFTTITETHPPLEIVDMLNSYFTEMEKAINNHQGVIDRFIGDAIIAIFYPAKDKPSQAIRAARAAIEMRERLKQFNKLRKDSGVFCIENGIGLATGAVVSGTIGNKGRKTYLVTGEPIILAPKIEASSALSESKVLICTKTWQICRNCFEIENFNNDIFELKRENLENI
jgi:class 3 adenylate cyclase